MLLDQILSNPRLKYTMYRSEAHYESSVCWKFPLYTCLVLEFSSVPPQSVTVCRRCLRPATFHHATKKVNRETPGKCRLLQSLRTGIFDLSRRASCLQRHWCVEYLRTQLSAVLMTWTSICVFGQARRHIKVWQMSLVARRKSPGGTRLTSNIHWRVVGVRGQKLFYVSKRTNCPCTYIFKADEIHLKFSHTCWTVA